MRRSRARREAERLLERCGIDHVPVDLPAIARELGLRVLRERLGVGISGLLVRTGEGTHICVAAGDPPTRRRFTVAHEIGHHVLGHEFEPGEHVHVDRGTYVLQRGTRASEGVDPQEIEANHFAACLLMPPQLVEREVASLDVPQLSEAHVSALARTFGVSEQSMAIRLTSLGLLSQ